MFRITVRLSEKSRFNKYPGYRDYSRWATVTHYLFASDDTNSCLGNAPSRET